MQRHIGEGIMRHNPKPAKPGQVQLAVIVALLVFVPLCFAAISQISETPDAPESFLEKPDPKYADCIDDGALYMRFHHWELLRSVREEVVRYGIRRKFVGYGKSINLGLSGCPECHTSRKRFCDQCHNAASVIPDCFGCHYYP
jgi:hypothetical protein